MATTPRHETLSELQALIDGLPRLCPGVTFSVAGKDYPVDEAVTFLRKIYDAENAVVLAELTREQAARDRARVRAEDGATLRGLITLLRVRFGGSLPALAELHVKAEQPRAHLSTEALLVKQAKAQATRLARGTKSRKQKAKIFGDVTGVVVRPTTGG